ncbi:hypothetical protein ESP47_16810 [Heyndrickxia coagulans]|nr:hypothetical protein CIW84_08795 [Heyndrickxia coagulans]ATW84173.1 hypothetical protein CIW84_14910 [Heyndrickxia coagulans]AWP35766.1 hypothetical protein CYJ15_01485 [Heyndrickxia coagulans]QAU26359.1 hypothetical protein ESP47_04250 [Heyndrickxia coagulans]QAU26509.1 hypothetical protein ESP47_05060 [Heyndrickxia coagulans]
MLSFHVPAPFTFPHPDSFWALTCSAALPCESTPNDVRVPRVRILPPASFRFHLTMDTLALG